jgi:hypothetical protein
MNLIRCLIEALNPCVHIDRVVATMYDNKDDPKVTTVVNSCDICGRISQTVTKAAGVCFHHWVTLRRVNVMANETDKIPIFHAIEQQCNKCGDVRKVNLKKGVNL